ncbi:hypothetical protein ACP70R_020596 [Stipagrostis hirtigluma subsp. patula]
MAATFRSRKRPRRWHDQTTAAASLSFSSSSSYLLPLDLMQEIAACSDPATLLRCAATCREMRRGVSDPAFRRRLRLRHGDGFVPGLLRGGLLVHKEDNELRLVDISASTAGGATTTRLLSAAECFPPGLHDDGEPPPRLCEPVAARDGLVLVRARAANRPGEDEQLSVCSLATGQSQCLPAGPTFPGQYVLLVGDRDGSAAVGRLFQVLKACLVLSDRRRPRLRVQTFSSAHGTWGTDTQIPAPLVRGKQCDSPCEPLVAGDAVHFVFLTDVASYTLKLHVGTHRVTAARLPARCGAQDCRCRLLFTQMLLATASPGGSLCLLVAGTDEVSAWMQSDRSGRWKKQPHEVIEKNRFLEFTEMSSPQDGTDERIRLQWFAERSGIVLVRVTGLGFFLLDLRSNEIVMWMPSSSSYVTYPYEMDLSSWAQSLDFSKTF